MIEWLMIGGIGLLAGCLLMLAFVPIVHERAVRIAKRHMVEATPLAINEIQADKDHLRAQFAMSVRRLELSIEEMRAKAAGHSGELSKQGLEITRLHVELDKKKAQIFAMRTREQIRKNMIRRIVKILMFMFVRSNRQRQRQTFEATLNHVTRRA
jgi:hypothetical protein